MQTAPLELPDIGKPYRPPRLFFNNGSNVRALYEQPGSRTHDLQADRLPELLQLVGQGIGGRRAYLVLPPISDRGTSISVEGWSRIEWHADGNKTLREHNYVLPDELRQPLLERIAPADTRGEVLFDDLRSEAVMPVFGCRSNFLGFLGIDYSDDTRPEVGRIRLLQDIVANQLQEVTLPRPTSRLDLQRKLDALSLPALMVVDGTIVCLNHGAELMLAGNSTEALLGHGLDDFVSAPECESVRGHISAVISGERERRFVCTIVGFDGIERRVQMHCRRYSWRQSISAEITLREVGRYPNYPNPLIESLSEAVWHIQLDTTVPCTAPTSSQVHLIRRNGSLVEANRSFAKILRTDSLERLLGRRLSNLLSPNVEELISAFVESGYCLREHEFFIRDADDNVRSFLVNATGTVEDGRLTDIWGSCSEVSDRIELERRTVSLQEEQKERIGRDLHDSVAPLLTGMRLLSGDIIQSQSMEADSLKGKIEKIASFAEQATDRLGEIYRGLVPRVLEEKSLAEALDLLVANLDELPGVSARFARTDGADVLQKGDKIQLYRIVQEAINNAIKHASAALIEVTLARENGRIVLRIRDDGRGFQTDVRTTDSLGLQNMKVRANTIGAKLSIDSKPGSGTTVVVSLAHAAARVH